MYTPHVHLVAHQAFVLPILHSILRGWGANSTQACNDHNRKCPYALIISPTRELAMQITTVANDLCSVFKQSARIEVVSIVGGMAEQKQVRLTLPETVGLLW